MILDKIASILDTSTDYLLDRTNDPRPIENINNKIDLLFEDPQINLFFKDFKDSPKERREEMLRFWSFIKGNEKSRNSEDKQ
ncbi:hypothetical protein D3C73_1285750 [compost metagenome]